MGKPVRNLRKRNFVRCPTCKSLSKVLFSEMGGYQTRRCRKGHTFGFNKWIADRIGTIAIFTGNVANPYDKAR